MAVDTQWPIKSCFYLDGPVPAGNQCIKLRTGIFTGLALVAFASNSILCRSALETDAIDAAGFSMLRLATGALILWVLTATAPSRPHQKSSGNFISALMLFAYAVTFSFAFVNLTTATGALILFGTVQATMFMASVLEGQKPSPAEYIGLAIALAGLGHLVFPGLDAPAPGAAILMTAAGISWGLYSLRGRGSTDPLTATRYNFSGCMPLVILLGVITYPSVRLSISGVLLAVASGGASALGYIIWYAALQSLNAKHGALVQLAVPVLAATGGVVFLSETVGPRLIVAAVLILGGIALAIVFPHRRRTRRPDLGTAPAPRATQPSDGSIGDTAEKR